MQLIQHRIKLGHVALPREADGYAVEQAVAAAQNATSLRGTRIEFCEDFMKGVMVAIF